MRAGVHRLQPWSCAGRSAGTALLTLLVSTAWATEGGGTSKAVGVDTVLAGVMPPPGLRVTTFVASYDADKTLDGAGNNRAGLSNFKLHVDAVTFRLQYVWPGAELWGAQVETRIGATAYANSRVQFDVQTPGGLVHRRDTVQSGGDMLLGPALLGWHGERLHQIAGLELFLPTGGFSAAKLANAGRGYLAYGPAYLATWLPSAAVEVSISGIYLINQRNPDTGYRSGRELSVDYGLGYAVSAPLQIGLSGYVYRQISDDRVNGQPVAGGNRGQALAAGPFVRYSPSRNWGVTLKWQHEAQVRNRAAGDRLFLQMAVTLL